MTIEAEKGAALAETAPPALSNSRRILIITIFFFSGLVLLLSLAIVVGAWAGRSAAIELVTEFTTGVDELAGVARNGISNLDGIVADVDEVVDGVQEATDQAAENVSDQGLLMTLLPPDISQQLESLAGRIRTTADSVISVLTAAADLVDAVRRLPFVDVPQTGEVNAIRNQIQAIQEDIGQLATDVRRFRENAAAEIATVAETAAQINERLENTQQELAQIDDKLAWLQDTATTIREQFPMWITVTLVLLTVILLWVSFGMVHLVRFYWREWQTHRPAGDTISGPAVSTMRDSSAASAESVRMEAVAEAYSVVDTNEPMMPLVSEEE